MTLLNCKINPSHENLNLLNLRYSWIPNENNVSPSSETIQKKQNDFLFFDLVYESIKDFVYIKYFNYDSYLSKNGKFKCNFKNITETVFLPNSYPYQVPEGTKHYVLWLSNYFDLSDRFINKEIYKSLKNLLKHNSFEFVWYENPKMSIPEVYHVQVFWRLIY